MRNIEEAEKASAQLDAAFSNTGRTLGLTRSRLDELATELQRTTRYGDDLVKEAESILLTFDKVRGEGFERTIKVAADLSARLGIDLKSAVRQVGIALQDPERGLISLRRSGIAFNETQRNIINNLISTGQVTKAQNIILSELEARFKGSAAAARNTLGGAIAGLKNAFGDLFEGTKQGTSGLVEAINGLSNALSDPELKAGLDNLIAGLGAIAVIVLKASGGIGSLFSSITDYVRGGSTEIDKLLTQIKTLQVRRQQIDRGENDQEKRRLDIEIAALQSELDKLTGRSGRVPRRPRVEEGIVSPDTEVSAVSEVSTTARALADEVPQFLRQMSDATLTETERQVAAYHELQEALEALRSEGLITSAQQEARLQEGLDQLLPEIDIQAIRKLYLPIRRETTELGEFMRGVWQNVGRSIHSTLSDALYEWRLSWRSLLDIARRALADITAAIITSGIKNALKSATSSSGGSSTASILGFIGSLFGLAGGGRFDGVRKVGEDGEEIVSGTGYVYNRRQMAFAGGGANITYAPSFQLNIESRGDEESERRMAQYVETRLAQDKAEFVRTLSRSGYEVKG